MRSSFRYQMPNYIMVDYVDVGHVFQVVDMLNGVKGPPSAPVTPARERTHAHLPHYSPRAVRAAASGERTEGWMPIRSPEQTYFSFR